VSFEYRLAALGRRLDDLVLSMGSRARGVREGVARGAPLRGAAERAGRLAARAREAAERRPTISREARNRVALGGLAVVLVVGTVLVTLRFAGGSGPPPAEGEWRALRAIAATRDAQLTPMATPTPRRSGEAGPMAPAPVKRSK
jgi:hypothetical protein